MEFGELNITSSRAFWDDYENNVYNPPIESTNLQWNWANNHSIASFKNLEKFVILEGEGIRSQINADNETMSIFSVCHLHKHKVSIYLLKNEKMAICLSEESNLNSFGIIAEMIADFIASSVNDVAVITVNILPITAYKIGVGEKVDTNLLIRGINPDIRTKVLELPVPNIFTGVTAAVASYRHHTNKTFSSYVIYKDSHKINLIDLPSVMSFFGIIGIPSDIFCDTFWNESSLYT